MHFMDETGKLASTVDINSLGEAKVEGDVGAWSPWRWPGQDEDVETGLYYNGYRYLRSYKRAVHRPDPIRIFGGLVLYGYATDPLWFIDPWGLDWNYRLVDANGDPYYYGRASDLDTPEGVARRHKATKGADGARFVPGSDSLEPITPRGTGPNAARGVEQLGVQSGGPNGGSTAIGRRSTNGGRVRGNNIRGVDPGKAGAGQLVGHGKALLTRQGLGNVADLPKLSKDEWDPGKTCT